MKDNDQFDAARLLSYKEAAKRLGISVSTLRGWVSDKRISYVKIGPRHVVFRPQDLTSVVTFHSGRG